MNDQLENAVISIINKSVECVDSSINFPQEEIPEMVHQLLIWNAVSNLSISILLFIVSSMWFYWAIYIPYKAIQKALKNKEETFFTNIDGSLSEEVKVLYINGLIVVPLVGSVYLLIDTLKIWIAPKIWLLEYAAS